MELFKRVIRESLREKQRGLCAICQQPLRRLSGKDAKRASRATLDHITPIAWGGADTEDNLRLAHAICNEYRGAGENFVFLAVLERAKQSENCVVYLLRDRLQRRRMKEPEWPARLSTGMLSS